jgi:ATP-binding cassette subfamily B protein
MKMEAVIMGAMTPLMRGRTTFMITRRLSTLDRCDVRLAIEYGRLVDTMVVTAEKGDRNDH